MVKIYCEEGANKESYCKQLHYFEGVHSASLEIARKVKESLDSEDIPEELNKYLDSMVKGSRREKERQKEYFNKKALDRAKESGEKILELEEDQREKVKE